MVPRTRTPGRALLAVAPRLQEPHTGEPPLSHPPVTDLVQLLQRALAGRYEIEGELGRGGMATVYRARDLRHGRQVAIKAIEADVGSDAASQRFQLEIRIVASLSHPHIVPLFDSAAEGDWPGSPCRSWRGNRCANA